MTPFKFTKRHRTVLGVVADAGHNNSALSIANAVHRAHQSLWDRYWRGPWDYIEVEWHLTDLEHAGYIYSTPSEDYGKRFYGLTDKGHDKLRERK